MENIKELYKDFETLKNISKINEKKVFLKSKIKDVDFRNFLKFLIDPRAITGINKAKFDADWTFVPITNLKSFKNLFEYLTVHNTGRYFDLCVCHSFIYTNCHKDDDIFEFIKAIICKTYKCGINVKLANLVYGEHFIETHEVQLGCSRDNLKLGDNEHFYLTQKLNGTRGTYVKGKILSRQGIPFTGLDHIIQVLNKYFPSYFIDGELIRKNIDNISDNENFRIGTGIINSDNKDKSSIDFVIFDIVPQVEIDVNKKSNNTYLSRRYLLNTVENILKANYITCIKVTPLLYHGTSKNDWPEIDRWLEYADSHNWEGIMLNKDAQYECKRTKNLIKIKSFKHSDLEIVGFEEGTGKNLGTLGAFKVKYKDNIVNVGSGLTDEQRRIFWNIKDTLLGKIIQVKYKEESTDTVTGLHSLQFPVFECLRLDKDAESIE